LHSKFQNTKNSYVPLLNIPKEKYKDLLFGNSDYSVGDVIKNNGGKLESSNIGILSYAKS
jgi:hypothetical protein